MDAPAALDKLMAGGALAALRARAAQLRTLQDGLERVLPAPLRGRVAATGLRDGVLAVAVADAALATRLRLQGPALCAQLRDAAPALQDVHTLRCRVAPAAALRPGPQRSARSAPARSGAGARALARAAGEVHDPGLAAALARLAGHLGRD